MRSSRIRYDRELCYYHLMNRVAGEPDYFPFGDVEKEQFCRFVHELNRFYALDMLSVVVMSNHWHIICVAPSVLPTKEEVMRRFRDYYGEKLAEPHWDNPEIVQEYGERMRDISQFVKDLQQRFTCWFNRTRPKRRRGRLWADRFKNSILQGETALWECIKYVELNPVRAGICAEPGGYRFSTWGRLTGSGTHPFQAELLNHLRCYLGRRSGSMSDADVLEELRSDMARVAAAERGLSADEIAEIERASRRGDGFVLTAARRVRYWSDGAVIGSKLFVREVSSAIFDPDRATSKRLARSRSGAALGDLYSYRRLTAQS